MSDEMHEHDETHEHDEEKLPVLELENEEGESYEFVFLGTVRVDDQDFAILALLEDYQDEDEDSLELYTFHYSETDDGTTLFNVIEDDGLAARVFEAAVAQLSEGDEE